MTDTEAINLLLKQHVAAANNGDPEAYAETPSPDVVDMPPDSPAVSGKEAVVAYMKEAFFELYESTFQVQFDDLEPFGNSAVARGSFSLVLKPKAGGEAASMKGKFMNTFRREPDGHWKYTHAI